MNNKKIIPGFMLPLLIILTGLPLLNSETLDESPVKMSESGREILVGVTPSPPFSFPDESGNWTGISVQLWNDIASREAIKFRLVPLTLSESLDSIEKGEIDVIAAALVVTADRERNMDFTHPFYTSGLTVATPLDSESTFVALMHRVFTRNFLVALGGLVLVLLIVGGIIWIAERRRNKQFGGTAAEGLGSGFWWSAVTMTTVGYGDKAPVTIFGRFVGLIWMFTSIIVISGFTGAIASALTVNSLKPRISEFNDLYHARVGVIQDSQAAAFLSRHNIGAEMFETTEAGLEAVRHRKIDGFVNDAPVLRYFVKKQYQGELTVLDTLFDQVYYSLALKEGSADIKKINQVLLEETASETWKENLNKYLGTK